MSLYRVYYNRSSDFPYVWSFDDGHSENEQNVTAIHGEFTGFNSAYDPQGDNINTPKAYFWIEANSVTIKKGEAWFTN